MNKGLLTDVALFSIAVDATRIIISAHPVGNDLGAGALDWLRCRFELYEMR